MNRMIRAALATVLALAPAWAAAQAYPSKPVKVVVSTVPGPLDAYARIILEKMSTSLKQPFVVENKAGAGGNVAAEFVKGQPADGYTLLFSIDTTFTVNPSVYKKLPFDPVKDFSPITRTGAATIIFVASPSIGAKTIKDLIALAKAKPRELNFGSPGSGTPHHLAGELLKTTAGIDLIHIPYKGAAPAVADLLGGQVHTVFVSLPAALPHVKSGKLIGLGITSPGRSAVAPELPTFAEQGLGGYALENWYGLLAPARTPTDIILKLNRETVKALQMADVKERLTGLGFETRTSTPDEFAVYIKSEIVKWAAIVKASGAKVD